MVFSPIRLAAVQAVLLAVTITIASASPPASMPRTGQTSCWDASGALISCSGTGQDGDKQSGVTLPTPRFSDNGNGTMTDNLTGLIWLKKIDACAAIGRTTWSFAISRANALASGQCGLTDGSKAGDWRLPNRKEMLSLFNREQGNSITFLNSYGFTGIQTTTNSTQQYWTSTTNAQNTDLVWSIDFSTSTVNIVLKANAGYIWPVRGGQ